MSRSVLDMGTIIRANLFKYLIPLTCLKGSVVIISLKHRLVRAKIFFCKAALESEKNRKCVERLTPNIGRSMNSHSVNTSAENMLATFWFWNQQLKKLGLLEIDSKMWLHTANHPMEDKSCLWLFWSKFKQSCSHIHLNKDCGCTFYFISYK